MQSQSFIDRLNRSLKLSLKRPPLFMAFMALVAAALSHQVVVAAFSLLQNHWSSKGLHAVAIAMATFWLFLGLCLNVRYFRAKANQERLTVQGLLQGTPALIRFAASFCSLFVLGALIAWCALFIKHALIQIPYLGLALSILFAWLPYALLLLFKLLPFVIAAFLYWMVPLVSSQRFSLQRACVRTVHLWKDHPLESILCILGGLLPLALALWLVSSLQHHTLHYLGQNEQAWVLFLRRLVLAIASAGVLAPAISLFGAWGYETLQWIQEQKKAHER